MGKFIIDKIHPVNLNTLKKIEKIQGNQCPKKKKIEKVAYKESSPLGEQQLHEESMKQLKREQRAHNTQS